MDLWVSIQPLVLGWTERIIKRWNKNLIPLVIFFFPTYVGVVILESPLQDFVLQVQNRQILVGSRVTQHPLGVEWLLGSLLADTKPLVEPWKVFLGLQLLFLLVVVLILQGGCRAVLAGLGEFSLHVTRKLDLTRKWRLGNTIRPGRVYWMVNLNLIWKMIGLRVKWGLTENSLWKVFHKKVKRK